MQNVSNYTCQCSLQSIHLHNQVWSTGQIWKIFDVCSTTDVIGGIIQQNYLCMMFHKTAVWSSLAVMNSSASLMKMAQHFTATCRQRWPKKIATRHCTQKKQLDACANCFFRNIHRKTRLLLMLTLPRNRKCFKEIWHRWGCYKVKNIHVHVSYG